MMQNPRDTDTDSAAAEAQAEYLSSLEGTKRFVRSLNPT